MSCTMVIICVLSLFVLNNCNSPLAHPQAFELELETGNWTSGRLGSSRKTTTIRITTDSLHYRHRESSTRRADRIHAEMKARNSILHGISLDSLTLSLKSVDGIAIQTKQDTTREFIADMNDENENVESTHKKSNKTALVEPESPNRRWSVALTPSQFVQIYDALDTSGLFQFKVENDISINSIPSLFQHISMLSDYWSYTSIRCVRDDIVYGAYTKRRRPRVRFGVPEVKKSQIDSFERLSKRIHQIATKFKPQSR